MNKEVIESQQTYTRPLVLSHQTISFETCHSWNKGRGVCPPQSNGNNGIHYPNQPYGGQHHGNGGNGQGNGPKKWGNG